MSDRKITTWKDLNDNDAHDRDDEMRNFVGGGKNAGQITVNPKDKDSCAVDSMFQKVQEGGAKNIEAAEGDANRVKITFWKGCFTVNDGGPRKLDDPANKDFVQSIEAGRVPAELGVLDQEVELIDKRKQDYQPPKRDITKLEGEGKSFGDSKEIRVESCTARQITLNESAPTTNVQIRFVDGKRQAFKFNLTHTVNDVRCHIEAIHPCGKPFALRKTYPPEVLDKVHLTLGELQLINTALIQETI